MQSPPLTRCLAFLLSMIQALCLSISQDMDLVQLNFTVGGRLRHGQPLAAPCFYDPPGEDCTAFQSALASGSPGYFRTSHYAGFQYAQSEGCIADPTDQCILDPVTLAPTQNSTCLQGVVSPVYLEVANDRDIQAILKYARSSGRSLSVKNSGHDYVMRSSRRGSLAIWTRGLKEMAFHRSFVPDGCTHGPDPTMAITFGSGVSTDEAYVFAHSNGVLFMGPTVSTVGASGGWLLNGGHGLWTGSYGLGVDRALQFKIVTPDGEVRIANKCTNQDLFWALRGGGGGSFGIVVDSTIVVTPEIPVVGAFLTFPATAENQRPFVSLLAENMPGWALEGWGGPSMTNASIISNPFLNVSQAETSLSPAIGYVRSQNGTVDIQPYSSYFEYYVQVVNGSLAAPEPVSTATLITNRVFPEATFQNDTTREYMVDSIVEAQAAGLAVTILTVAPLLYGRNHSDPGTSIHPAWYKSVWVITASIGWAPSSPFSVRKDTAALLRNTTERLVMIAPDGCTYGNEADPWLEDWSDQIWGENYNQLLDVKKNFDPDGLLSCWHCVGWDSSLSDYECISQLS